MSVCREYEWGSYDTNTPPTMTISTESKTTEINYTKEFIKKKDIYQGNTPPTMEDLGESPTS